MKKPLTYYVMSCIDGDECAVAYEQTLDAAEAKLRDEARRMPDADLSIWTNAGGIVAVWNRGTLARVGR
jgi:hypothetical protein